MSSQIRVRSSFDISGDLQYRSFPTDFQDIIESAKGPSPGAFSASTAGVDVDLSEVTPAGYCRITNLDAEHSIEWGLHDGSAFYPVGEIGPRQFTVLKLSENLGFTVDDMGTGTSGSGIALRIRGLIQPCDVIVEAFKR